VAYDVMRAVADGAYANLALPSALRHAGLRGRDAAFATELTYGAIRLEGRYDPIIAAAAGREIGAIDPAVLDTLRLGVHQLLGMRVPSHAATAETVGLARAVHGAGASGFVNAVLRRVGEVDLDTWVSRLAPTDPTGRRAFIQSHPEWVVTALRAARIGHGAATAQTVDDELDALLAADNEPAAVSLVARPGLSSVAELVAAGAIAGRWAPTAAPLPGGDPGSVAAVRDGRAAVQDEGSQLVALALAAVPVDPAPGGAAVGAAPSWLDLCAGPGGKAGLLAALARGAGAHLVANEVSEHRAELVRKTLAPAVTAAAKVGLRVETRVGDGRDVGVEEPATYDRVLVDAPCTGLGALRRRPEARWRRLPSDVPTLATLQRELLAAALQATRPGGVVAYVTCSPHLAETRFVVADVVKKRHDVEVLDASRYVVDASGQPLPGMGEAPYAQLWPHRHGTDAMFLALLRRT
jgi:16S rRNA (cytosine967-C5)-methyltransferase